MNQSGNMHATFSRVLVFCALLATTSLHGQGTVVYRNPPDIPLFVEHAPYDLDLDQNGVTDYTLIKTGGDFTAYGMGHNASLALPERPPDLGAYILPLSAGENIGPIPTAPDIWFETYSFEPSPGQIVRIPGIFHGCVTVGCGPDPFHDVTAYWEVQFEIDGNLHYGWVQVATPGNIRNGGTFLDWAYNSVPGQLILAGQVPEPSPWALLIGGGTLLWWRHRRKVKLSG